jgi:uncharacterized protein
MSSPLEIIKRYYPEDNELRRLLVHHSTQVAAHALGVAARHPELHLDADLLYRGAMLHDIGICRTDAPGIHCHGTLPYLLHGRCGAEMMRTEGDEAIARICERHTGTGLTAEQIQQRGLPLPAGDYCPETLEEQVVCYADKFYSKSHPEGAKPLERVVASLEKFGMEGVDIFLKWHKMFG